MAKSKSLRDRVRVKGSKVILAPDRPKMSETLLAFARPLLDNLPQQPPTAEQVRHVLGLATIVWNLPLVEGGDPHLASDAMASLSETPADLGEGVQELLAQMLQARRAEWAHDRRVVSVEVVECEGGYKILAEGVDVPR